MKIPWKILIFLAVVVTLGMTAFDFMLATDADPNLAQYDVTDISSNLGVEVLQHIADSNELVYVHSDEIGVSSF